MSRDKFRSCEACKPSTWSICRICGTHVCQHERHRCHEPRLELDRVVPTYTGEYSVRVADNQGSYSTQSSPEYYRRKDVELWERAAELAGLVLHVQRVVRWSHGKDWYGRTYGINRTYYVAWIETNVHTEREDRQRFADRLKDAKLEQWDRAMGLDRESYERKETVARLTGAL